MNIHNHLDPSLLPLIDVVIPVYNYASAVPRAIQSVKNQTLTNFRCYIVDDGSTDDSAVVIQREIEDDPRFTYIHQENSGVAVARNKGVLRSGANGKYIVCLDADDALAPEYLEVCARALEEDNSISIAYTGLYYYKPDGEEGLSTWPPEWDYNAQIRGLNQIPTCNMARREVWERLGGQRQRYAPEGAGEEDAELWLRAGAYGFRAKKVTTAGLFLYSWQSGRVSGNKNHRMTDYMGWHPWAKNGEHPFASLANPANGRPSHPVRQYDQPAISVVIPVGPNHHEIVIDALDSLEAQTFTRWEAILAWDNPHSWDDIQTAYPFVRVVQTHPKGKMGSGYARNRGAEIARAPFLTFLDADDWLLPNALEVFLEAYAQTGEIIYSDAVEKAFNTPEFASRLGDRLLEFDEKTGLTTFVYKAPDFDCNRAVSQPDVDMYLWCLITCLIPTAWHRHIGGFDENMKSWEDWDYFVRMARQGICFQHISQPLVVYRLYSGGRRDEGLHDYPELIKYLQDKYRGIPAMSCNCGSKKARVLTSSARQPIASARLSNSTGENTMNISDEEMLLIVYMHPNQGQHKVIGQATARNYGYRGRGERFLVHRGEQRLQPQVFQVVQETPTPQAVEIHAEAAVSSGGRKATPPPAFQRQTAPPPPKVLEEITPSQKGGVVKQPMIVGQSGTTMSSPMETIEVEVPVIDDPIELLSLIPGVTPQIVESFVQMGIGKPNDLKELTKEQLTAIKGIGAKRADQIIAYVATL